MKIKDQEQTKKIDLLTFNSTFNYGGTGSNDDQFSLIDCSLTH